MMYRYKYKLCENKSHNNLIAREPIPQSYYEQRLVKTCRKQEEFLTSKTRIRQDEPFWIRKQTQQHKNFPKSQSSKRAILDTRITSCPYACQNYQEELTKTIGQLKMENKQYQYRLRSNQYQLGRIAKMLDVYFATNRSLANQYQCKIRIFQKHLLQISEGSGQQIEELEERLLRKNAIINYKNKRIEELLFEVTKQQLQISKFNLYTNQNSRKFPFHNKSVNRYGKQQDALTKQISFRNQLAQALKDNQVLKDHILKIKEGQKGIINSYEEMILQKEKIIKHMSQFNDQMCLTLLRQKELSTEKQISLNTIKQKHLLQEFRQQSFHIDGKESELTRAKSQKQINILGDRLYQQKLILQQDNCFLARQLQQLREQNQNLKDNLQRCEKKIHQLQQINKDKETQINELIKSTQKIEIKEQSHPIHFNINQNNSQRHHSFCERYSYLNKGKDALNPIRFLFYRSPKEPVSDPITFLQQFLKDQHQRNQNLKLKIKSFEVEKFQQSLNIKALQNTKILPQVNQFHRTTTRLITLTKKLFEIEAETQQKLNRINKEIPSNKMDQYSIYNEFTTLCSIIRSQKIVIEELNNKLALLLVNFDSQQPLQVAQPQKVANPQQSAEKVFHHIMHIDSKHNSCLGEGNEESHERKTNPQ